MPIYDAFHRAITYLRVSITDRCNLRCRYCVPKEGIKKLPHEEILRYEEILRIVKIAAQMGFKKVRITGGEPLVRKDVVYLIEKIGKIEEIEKVCLTT
ncbi:radical SAM protein, partial [Desulfonauticus submarinus]